MIKKRMLSLLLTIILGSSLIACGDKTTETKNEEKKDKKQNIRIIKNNKPALPEDNAKKETAKKNILVAIDPGHQGSHVDMSQLEANAPGSSEMKTKATGGTTGKYSQVPEYQLTLDISLLLKEELEKRGYDTLLTRENNDTAISNSERALLANDAGADISIRIHANGSDDSSVNGALALIPSSSNPYAGTLYADSNQLAEAVLQSYCDATKFKNAGIQTNDTMTGINWSKIPVIILEMGFMSNEQDDMSMADSSFRMNMVTGIADGLDKYYGYTNEPLQLDDLKAQVESALSSNIASGEMWSVSVENLTENASMQFGNQSSLSASVIKLFVAACVYQHISEVNTTQAYPGETAELLHQMISASDNDATNKLVKKLGAGNAAKGLSLINDYCSKNGFPETHMGRLMLDFSASDDNYTSINDCSSLLKQIYNREFEGAEQIFNSMSQQERRGKIPTGIPSNIAIANKTGELDNVENDVAIITTDTASYSLCILSQNLTNCSEARNKIQEISKLVYTYINSNS